ncbi:hypothetical protein K458DRAFT_397034 [Lentithecium fluviatile CBS 122367]|uniref:Uncharacterized protein n=1 Tax=Lentithecium fluviatile CBS 122367 TaxID=1168545 RepID=A0A6G1IEA4_9PLEO|nr:hypothetical protein K458DRAFT_397034 [Lentithecium fluviatile CBS 122367]
MHFVAATTLLFATLALATPAPVAQPEADAASALAPLAPNLAARAAGIHLDARDPKKSKPKGSSGSNSNDTEESAALMIAPSRVLELGALGLGVVEIVRLWG